MPGVYDICVQDHFAAAHSLRGYDGNCSNLHGHNWVIEAHIRCSKLNPLGMGIDFRDVKSVIKEVLSRLDHTNLNDIPEFRSMNPTAENLAQFLYTELSKRLNTEFIKVQKIMVFESPGCGSSYQEI